MTVHVHLSPDPRVWVPVPMAWPTAQHPSAEAWARTAGPALVAEQGIDDAELGERLGIVLSAVAATAHPDHVQARFLHLPDVRAGFMLLEVSAVETDPSANRHLVHRALTEADREPDLGAVQVEAVALPDGRALLRVLRFDRPSAAGPVIGILRHAVRLPALPGARGAVDVVTTITGSDLEALLRTLGDVESLLEEARWAPDAPENHEEKEHVWTAS
ncbi:hypothetical protein [Georgenia sp. SUBG003]|uniref:hypothetical protein n=1 Tax=Georgenia sp. SUBG003 TaxID=1497974 RepID=UPI003AB444AB